MLIYSIKYLTLQNRNSITIYYHGKPRIAVKPPWDGGVTLDKR